MTLEYQGTRPNNKLISMQNRRM